MVPLLSSLEILQEAAEAKVRPRSLSAIRVPLQVLSQAKLLQQPAMTPPLQLVSDQKLPQVAHVRSRQETAVEKAYQPGVSAKLRYLKVNLTVPVND